MPHLWSDGYNPGFELRPFVTGYTKLFSQIVTSTIWQEPNDCRVLWITMLALKEKDNVCRATVPALAKLASLSLEDTVRYLEQFQQPDKYSRSQEHEGRRIAPAEDGWLILNGSKYQEKMSADHRREQVKEAVARHRKKRKLPEPGTRNGKVFPAHEGPLSKINKRGCSGGNPDELDPTDKEKF